MAAKVIGISCVLWSKNMRRPTSIMISDWKLKEWIELLKQQVQLLIKNANKN
ncbi:MAG: hypothetical protein JWP78_648 [Mucilaginibacter sp.]|nr:hypothetical protein [Mucilaginibacter sp.]